MRSDIDGKEYFDKLFNCENTDTTFQLDDSFDDTNRRVMWGRSYSRTRRARDVRRAAERARDQAAGTSEASSEPESGYKERGSDRIP